ncbi:MAG: hypothetical protein ACR2JC_13200 [Chloroflexota bacterium]|nr:MAG: hypothetical protein DLM70_01265 [Chloroflexota bacterium]
MRRLIAIALALVLFALPHKVWAADAFTPANFFTTSPDGSTIFANSIDIPTLTPKSAATGSGFILITATNSPCDTEYASGFSVTNFVNVSSDATFISSAAASLTAGSKTADLYIYAGGQAYDLTITLDVSASCSELVFLGNTIPGL